MASGNRITGAKPPPRQSIAQQKAQDPESIQIIDQGITVAQIARARNKKPETVKTTIVVAGIKPVGTRAGADIYDLFEACALFNPPPVEFFDRYMQSASHHDLPPLLTKEYWAGLSMRAKYEREAGDLWHTAEILQGIAQMQKIVRMMLLTLPDQMHRQKPLDPSERRLVKDICDNTLRSLESSINEAFGKPLPDAEQEPDPVLVRGAPTMAGGGVEDAPPAVEPAEGPIDPAWDL